jgi:hypothetical protein
MTQEFFLNKMWLGVETQSRKKDWYMDKPKKKRNDKKCMVKKII